MTWGHSGFFEPKKKRAPKSLNPRMFNSPTGAKIWGNACVLYMPWHVANELYEEGKLTLHKYRGGGEYFRFARYNEDRSNDCQSTSKTYMTDKEEKDTQEGTEEEAEESADESTDESKDESGDDSDGDGEDTE